MEVRDLVPDDVPVLRRSGIPVDRLIQPRHRVHLAVDPHIVGLVVWNAPERSHVAHLKAMLLTNRAPQDTIHHLALHAANAAKAEGFTHAIFDLQSVALLDKLTALYGIQPLPAALNPESGKPLTWSHTIDLNDALGLLAAHLPVSTS